MAFKEKNSIFKEIATDPDSTILILDVSASEFGALAILDDIYSQIRNHSEKSIKWIFVLSSPEYKNTDSITVLRYPWVKKNWVYRFFFDTVILRKILKEFKPDKVFSLQNKGIPFCRKPQYVYLHLPFILTDHRFDLKKDGKRLWLYQNVISKVIIGSLRHVEKIIVQTQWMKKALIEKAHVETDKIVVNHPDIPNNKIGSFIDTAENRRRFFFPASAYTYKNHWTLLKAVEYSQSNGLKDYEVILTIDSDENKYSKALSRYVKELQLNVKFKGLIPREEVFDLYTKSVLLFPSYVESFGLPLLEARLSGTYIIASNCQFSKEILENYDKVQYFNEMDYKKMGDCMLKLQQ